MSTQGDTSAHGRMIFKDQEGQSHSLLVSEASFTVFKMVPSYPADAVQLSIMVATEPKFLPNPDFPEYPHRLAPSVTTEWLDISQSQFASRGRDALDGFSCTYKYEDGHNEAPAALYDDNYGSLFDFHLDLALEGDRYRLRIKGRDDLKREVTLDASIALFDVGARHEDRSQNPEVEAWMATHFDPAQMQVGWERKGSADHSWFDLYGRWT